jgi:transposase
VVAGGEWWLAVQTTATAVGCRGRGVRAELHGWLQARPRDWLAQVGTVALDPWRGYASALVAPLGHVTVVVDHVHAIRLANVVADQAHRRMQQVTLGHRGRTYDSLYASASCW